MPLELFGRYFFALNGACLSLVCGKELLRDYNFLHFGKILQIFELEAKNIAEK